jgi:hypothetical protein
MMVDMDSIKTPMLGVPLHKRKTPKKMYKTENYRQVRRRPFDFRDHVGFWRNVFGVAVLGFIFLMATLASLGVGA